MDCDGVREREIIKGKSGKFVLASIEIDHDRCALDRRNTSEGSVAKVALVIVPEKHHRLSHRRTAELDAALFRQLEFHDKCLLIATVPTEPPLSAERIRTSSENPPTSWETTSTSSSVDEIIGVRDQNNTSGIPTECA
jgi:hypothetical protein